nr:MAG TPA: hypothetical protein [Bacteriophage sp.]
MDILDYIPTGHNNAIPRKELQRLTRMNDREIRKLIADTNKNAPDDVLIINMQDGMGYFRPAPDEKYLVRNWRMQMRSRASENDEGADAADRYLNAMKAPKKQHSADFAGQMDIFDFLDGG